MDYIIKGVIIITGILLLTFLQKYHYIMLYYVKKKSGFILSNIIGFLIRIGVIIHEFAHIFFGFLSGSKIKKIELFKRTGGSVTYETKNYIGSMSENYHKSGFFLFLLLNQIGIFLTSIGPLVIGILINYLFLNYLFGITSFESIINNPYLLFDDYFKILYLFLYFTVIQSFILSWKDISHLIVSKQSNLIATIFGSVINIFIFFLFIFGLTLVFDYFLIFYISYIFVFLVVLFFFGIYISLKYLFGLKKR